MADALIAVEDLSEEQAKTELARLAADPPDLVQLVDGDCEVQPGWVAEAAAFLAMRPEVVVVCGRRRERYPEASVYNRLCDREWDTPLGAAGACASAGAASSGSGGGSRRSGCGRR